MYTKYEEMKVMKQVMSNYADNQKRQYESTIILLKEQVNGFPLDINSDSSSREISSLESKAEMLSDYKRDYGIALSIVSELNKATMCYEQAYTPEQIQPGGIAEQRAKEGNRIFHELRTQNPEYIRIMDEISNGLYVDGDKHLDGLEQGLDSKIESLEKEFEEGKISKEQLIFYTNMCVSISKSNPSLNEEQAPMHR